MKATIHGLRIAIVALAGYWLLLFIGTHLPPNPVLSYVRLNDKLVHACAFAGLSFLVAWAVPTNKTKLNQNVIVAALISVVYAGVDELLQIPVGRLLIGSISRLIVSAFASVSACTGSQEH